MTTTTTAFTKNLTTATDLELVVMFGAIATITTKDALRRRNEISAELARR